MCIETALELPNFFHIFEMPQQFAQCSQFHSTSVGENPPQPFQLVKKTDDQHQYLSSQNA